MKKIFYPVFLTLVVHFSAMGQWARVDVLHNALDAPYDVEVPNDHTVWASLWNLTDPSQPYTPFYYRTADGGANWDYGFVPAPPGYIICSMAAIDEDTCYAIMVNITAGLGGGIFKTVDGGATWNQLAVGQIFNENSFPDFIYFWNAREGIALGDANGPGDPYMEIYTTEDYGVTWTRVPRANIPAENIFSITNSYCVVGDRIWCQATDNGTTHEVWRSLDRGFHWESVPIAITTAQFNDIAFTDELHGVVIGNDAGNPYLFSTKDGGETWSRRKNYTGDLMPTNVENIPGTTTLVSTNYSAAGPVGSSYSEDNGETWVTIDGELHSNLKFLNTGIGWSGELVQDLSAKGGMFKWTGPTLPTQTCFTDTFGYEWHLSYYYDGGRPRQYHGTGKVYIESGRPWTVTEWGTFDHSNGEVELHAVNPHPDGCINYVDSLVYTGNAIVEHDGTVSYSGSGSWKSYCAGNMYDEGTWEATGPCERGDIKADPNGPARHSNNISILVSPNPVKNFANISYNLAKQSQVNITIYNYLQQPVKIITNEVQSAGRHTYNWNTRNTNGSQLANGLYRVFAVINGKSYSSAMQVMR